MHQAEPDPIQHQPRPDTLEGCLERIWAELGRGVADTRHGFHWPVVATVGADGTPSARVVVLRSCDPDAGLLTFHTDRLSPKVAALRERPTAALTFHCGRRKLQLRAVCEASIEEEGPLFEAGWSRIGLGSKRCYLAPSVPSSPSPVQSPNLQPEHLRGLPSEAEAERGRERFCVVACRIRSLDLVILGKHGHLRAGFGLDEGKVREQTWLQP